MDTDCVLNTLTPEQALHNLLADSLASKTLTQYLSRHQIFLTFMEDKIPGQAPGYEFETWGGSARAFAHFLCEKYDEGKCAKITAEG